MKLCKCWANFCNNTSLLPHRFGKFRCTESCCSPQCSARNRIKRLLQYSYPWYGFFWLTFRCSVLQVVILHIVGHLLLKFHGQLNNQMGMLTLNQIIHSDAYLVCSNKFEAKKTRSKARSFDYTVLVCSLHACGNSWNHISNSEKMHMLRDVLSCSAFPQNWWEWLSIMASFRFHYSCFPLK